LEANVLQAEEVQAEECPMLRLQGVGFRRVVKAKAATAEHGDLKYDFCNSG
jgi:hypothetical protein